MRKRLVQCAAVAASMWMMGLSSAASADTLELEGSLLGTGQHMGPGFRFGVVLSERLTLGAGVAATVQSFDSSSLGGIGGLAGGGGVGSLGAGSGAFSFAIPIDLKIWLLPALEGRVSPTIRLVGTYARSTVGNYGESHSYGGGGLVGAAYMLDEVVGLSLEAGVEYRRTRHESPAGSFESEAIDLGYRGSLILRI